MVLLAVVLAGLAGACAFGGPDSPVVEKDVAVPMRDGVVLRANVWRPATGGPFPTLVYRTPYGKDQTESWYATHRRAVERGYAVVIQDVRGRYESEGDFFPYVNEGRDGFDTIEWAARQPWSNGSVGTFGLSYPGAVQWLAALEGPPHLEAMVPAMTFSSPRRFFYSNGVWDLSWLAWVHNSIAPDTRRRLGLPGPVTGDLDFGPDAALDYDELILGWMDRYLRGIDTGGDREAPVQIFVMGENRWRDEPAWPPPSRMTEIRYLTPSAEPGMHGGLSPAPPPARSEPSAFCSDPMEPTRDPYDVFGPHDYSGLGASEGVLVFETEPFGEDTEITGAITAEIFFSCDRPDADLWVKVLDVGPDGAAFNLMSPGSDVQRASLRDPNRGREPLEPGEIYSLTIDRLLTSQVFFAGHRLRILVTGSFFPHFSRNPQTGESEALSSEMATAEIRIHHDAEHPSRLVLPVIPR